MAEELMNNPTSWNLTMSDNIKLTRGPGAILGSDKLDIALVPLNMPDSRARERCIPISESELTPESKFWGASLQDNYSVVLNCEVVEWYANRTAQTNCGGGPGFSGTGYADPEGNLGAIHIGEGVYLHVGDRGRAEEFSHTLNQRVEDAMKICTETGPALSEDCVHSLTTTVAAGVRDPGSPNLKQRRTLTMNHCTRAVPAVSEKCVNSLMDIMTILARNPRSRVVDASCLFDLVNPHGPHRCLNKLGKLDPSVDPAFSENVRRLSGIGLGVTLASKRLTLDMKE
jgi:hypothetical protein